MNFETTDYISYIREHRYQLDGFNHRPTLLLFAMSGKYDSELYPLLNCAAMELLMLWCREKDESIEHVTFNDADKCIAAAYKCLKEHVSCIIEKNPTINSFNVLIPTYEDADIGELKPFKTITSKKNYISLNWVGNGLYSTPLPQDEITPDNIGGTFRRLALTLHMMTRSDFVLNLDKYARQIEWMPTVKEMRRIVKETPPIKTIVKLQHGEKLHSERLMNAIIKGNLEGKYAYAAKSGSDGIETVLFTYTGGFMKRTHISDCLLMSTNHSMFQSNPFKQYARLADMDMSSLNDAMMVYQRQIETHKTFLDAMRKQMRHIRELCGMDTESYKKK